MDYDMINDLIYIKDSITFILNLDTQLVEVLYNDNSLIGSNITYLEFAELICEAKNFSIETKNKFYRFLTYFNSDDDDFSMQLTVQYKDFNSAIFNLIGYALDKNKYVISMRKNQGFTNKFDDLTKLYKYDYIISDIEKEINENKKLIIMLINIDNFTEINKTYGFLFGDLVLIETGAAIKKSLGINGKVGRLKGDEFIAYEIVEDTDYDPVKEECKRIRNSITNITKSNIKQAKITATMGTVIYPVNANNINDLLLKANKALKRGKLKGGNCFVMYSTLCEGPIYNDPIIPNDTLISTGTSNEAKIIIGVFEILNHGSDLKRNITDCLNLIGTFFKLDRVAIFYKSIKNNEYQNDTYLEWINPEHPELKNVIRNEYSKIDNSKLIYELNKNLNTLGALKINQIEANKSLGFTYDVLKLSNTSAIIFNELSYVGKTIGIIRYENTLKNRFWSVEESSNLLVISKLIAMTIYKELEKKDLEDLIIYDKLTGAYNYTKWRDEVENFIATIDKYPNYSIIAFSVLAFNNLVIKNGIIEGDKIIKCIAQALKENIFDGFIYCRVNDDKFLLFIANKNKEEITEIILNIENYVKNHFIDFSVNVLAGVYYHKDIEELSTCIDNANIALKNANANNQLIFFNDEIEKKEKHKNAIELHMKEALENNEFLLYLQPKVNTITGKVIGAEALTRWNYNFEKIIFPNEFIPIFEETGFITDLDYNVFENACRFLRNIIDEGYEPIKISVNVSRYQKNFNTYLKNLNKIRKKYNIDSKYLEIEITESMYSENVEEISKFIDNLHKYGYFVSMDDFGSGYSNLASLAKLDFDIIKLDKTFCNDLNNPKEQIILTSIMNLVKNLNIDILCEGVETKELVLNLQKLGCFIVQGYYYSKPIPSLEFKEKYLIKLKD